MPSEYSKLIYKLRNLSEKNSFSYYQRKLMDEAANTIEKLAKDNNVPYKIAPEILGKNGTGGESK